jgi:predicted phage-related endonuclease
MKTADAIAHYKSAANLVRALSRSRTPRSKGAVSMWGELVPLIVAHEIEAISGGAVKVELDLYENPTNPKKSAATAAA